MRRIVFIAAISLLSLLTLAPTKATQSILCRSASYLRDSTAVSGSNTTCYRFAVPKYSSLLQITLESSSGAADLYVSEGAVYSLSGGHKVTPSATTGKTTYVVLEPAATTYTIAAVPSSTRGSYRLTATTASSSRDRPSLSCSRSSCAATYKFGGSISLGSSYGDQLIFPVMIGSSGLVSVKATWSGNASDLALALYGPSTQSSSPTTSYARTNGRNPLSLSYNLTSTVARRGEDWQVSLVNNDRTGGSASGSLAISYPSKLPTSYLAPIQGPLFSSP